MAQRAMALALAFAPIWASSQVLPNPPKPHDSLAAECPQAAYPAWPAEGQSLARLQEEAAHALAVQGLELVWSAPEGTAFEDTPADRERLSRLLSVVVPALSAYPAVLLDTLNIRTVVLVKDLAVSGQRRLAMPAPDRDALLYADNGYAPCAAGMELRVHHELYHLLDHREHGDFYHRDPDWAMLNPPGFAYGQGGATAYAGLFDNLGHPAPGMVSRYAQFGLEEDKAELFGWMMTPGYASRVAAWASQDGVLAAKQAQLLAQLSRLSRGAMDAEYFRRLAVAPPRR